MPGLWSPAYGNQAVGVVRHNDMLRYRILAPGLVATALLAGCGSARSTSLTAGRHESVAGDHTAAAAPGGAGGEPAMTTAADAKTVAAPSPGSATAPAPSGPVTAGSVDDNERFDDYLAYRTAASKAGVLDVDVTGRRVIRVVGTGGHAVLGARVVVGEGPSGPAERGVQGPSGPAERGAQGPSGPAERGAQGPHPLLDARTHSDGRALFLPKASDGAGPGPWPVTVEAGGARATASLAADGPDLTVTVGPEAKDPGKLDVVFLLDATGSMGDELGRLTDNMASTAAKVEAAAGPGSQVRFGLTAFKDRGDDYVTRTSDLTADVGSFRSALAKVKAAGGGDTPESVSAGLHEAVTKPSWGGDDVAKVIVLVGDAAPHTDYQDEPSYAADARAAAARGIRVHAIASSGLGDQGEYAFRQMAQLTAGRFVFLTYGADGGPGGSTTHHVDKYAVKSLDELVATLLTEELHPGGGTQ